MKRFSKFWGTALVALLAISFGMPCIATAQENSTDSTTTSTLTETTTTLETTTTSTVTQTTTSTTIRVNVTDNLTNEDEEELEDFIMPPGARLRFLQLERALMKNILIGINVVEVLEENHPEANLSKLNVILAEMEELLNETRNTSLDIGPIEVAKKFVEIKKMSINLTHEFRDEARKYITQEDRLEIHEAIKNLKEELKAIDGEIKQARCEINAQRVGHILNMTNISDPGLVEQVRNCNATMSQVQLRIRNRFWNLTYAERVQAIKNTKSAIINRIQERNQIMQQVREELHIRLQERRMEMLSKRMAIMANLTAKAGQWAEKRAGILDEQGLEQRAKVMEQVSNRLQQRSEWAQQIAERLNQRAGNTANRGR